MFAIDVKTLYLPIDTLLVATIHYLRKPTNAEVIISQVYKRCQLRLRRLQFEILEICNKNAWIYV